MKKAVCVLLSASWFLSIAITWTLASKFSQTKSTENPSVLSDLNKSTIDESNPGSSSKNNSHQTRISIPRKPIVTRSSDILLEDLENITDMGKRRLSAFEGMEVLNFLNECSSEELKDLLKSTQDKPDSLAAWGLLRTFALMIIAKSSPDDAVELFYELRANVTLKEGESRLAFLDEDIIDAVLSHDPLKALNIIENDTKGLFEKGRNYEFIFRKLSETDYNTAIIKLKNLEDGDYRDRTRAILGISSSLKTTDDFLDFAEQVDISKENTYVINSFLNNWASISPIDSLRWTKKTEEKSLIYQKWLLDEPMKATEWIMSTKTDKSKGYSEIIQAAWNNHGAYKRDSYLELRKWLEQQPQSDEKEAAYMTRILNSKDDPQLKAEYLKSLKSEEKRKNAAKIIYKQMVEKIKQEPHNRRFYSKLSAKFLRSNNDLSDEEKRHLKNKTAEDVKNSLLRGLN